jgi:hypothetical protein
MHFKTCLKFSSAFVAVCSGRLGQGAWYAILTEIEMFHGFNFVFHLAAANSEY